MNRSDNALKALRVSSVSKGFKSGGIRVPEYGHGAQKRWLAANWCRNPGVVFVGAVLARDRAGRDLK